MQRGMRLQSQQHMKLADLQQVCSAGTRKNIRGDKQHWRRFKLHWDIADGLPKTAMALRKECFF